MNQKTTNTQDKRTKDNWAGLFDNVGEVDIQVKDIEGKIPSELVGTLYRNGPGERRFSQSFFDGDGMVRAISINEKGEVHYKSRYVHTPKYLKERHSKKPKVRTAGTNLPGGILKNCFKIPADEANTHVFYQNGKLLASEEGGHPWRMDPITLETEAEEHFGKALPRQVAFSAHPHYDADTKEVYNFGMKPGKTMGFQCFKLDKNQKLKMLANFSCDKGSFAHDYALSKKWMAFLLPPLAGNLTKFFFGFSSFFDTMKWHDNWGTQIVLVPRDGGKPIIFETDSFGVGHVLSAWDEGDDLLIDVATVENMDIMNSVGNYRSSDWREFGDGVISRIRINPKTKSIKKHTITDLPGEFPRIHPKMECIKTEWAYLAANTQVKEGGFFKALMKLNRDTGDHSLFDFGDQCVAQEPVFIPKTNEQSEDDGWLMALVYNSQSKTTDLVILDALGVSDGPVATIHLPLNAGTTFHGTWVRA
jgi:all-trans-8'-apo-beta-carotenal 15,15'-oxygenase